MRCSRCGEDNALISERCGACGRSLLAPVFSNWKRSVFLACVCLYVEGLFYLGLADDGASQTWGTARGDEGGVGMALYTLHRFFGPVLPQIVAVGCACGFFLQGWRRWKERN